MRWQIVAPSVAIVSGFLALAGREHMVRERDGREFVAASLMRDRLERVVTNLWDCHFRAIRRVRGSMLLDDDVGKRRVTAWTAERYLADIERFADAATQATRSFAEASGNERLHDTLAALERQLEQVVLQGETINEALRHLHDVISTADSDILQKTLKELSVADRVQETTLRIAMAMARRAGTRRMPTTVGSIVPVMLWSSAFIALPFALWLSQRPAGRLRQLPDRIPSQPKSPEEAAIVAEIRQLRATQEDQAAQLSERTLEGLRAEQTARRLQHELALLQLYNDNLVNSLRSAIVVTDSIGIITAANRQARHAGICTGDTEASIRTQPLWKALATHHREAADKLNDAATGDVLRAENVPFVRDGRTMLLDIVVTPYRDESGATRGLIWISDDVTDQVQTKNQLLAAERLAAVGRLSAQVAHEIRNPLSAIALNAELLEEELTGTNATVDSEARVLLTAIAGEIERLTEVTEGYLQLARMPRPSFQPTDTSQLLSNLFGMLAEELRASQIHAELDLATPPPIALVDPSQLRQALLNIVRNSREAMKNGGHLRVSTSRSGHRVAIRIVDDGPGIPNPLKRRIFEPFFSTKAEGTGLGLSLTRQIVEDHGGSIDVSDAIERGTMFSILLPEADLLDDTAAEA